MPEIRHPQSETQLLPEQQVVTHEVSDDSLALGGLNAIAQAVGTPEKNTTGEAFRKFTNPYERIEYMHLTDDLIATLDGSEEGSKGPYDTVIYLDSSARPVDWMVRGLWDFAAQKDADGNPVSKPETLFSNMDARRTGHDITPEDTAELIQTYPTLRDAKPGTKKRVLIVDEIAVSGDTIDTAASRFRAAFPDIEFDGYAWKDERNTNDLNNVRWYERNDDRYRLVLDPGTMTTKQREQLTERGIRTSAGKWLSVPNPVTEGAHALRSEIDRMVEQIKTGEMPYWPSGKRSSEEIERRTIEANDGLSELEFAHFRQWMKRHYAPSSRASMIVTDAMGPLTDKEAMGYLRTDRERRAPKPKLDETTAAFADKFGYLG